MPKEDNEMVKDNTNLDEVKKASYNVDAEVPDPVKKDAKSPEDDNDPNKEKTHLKSSKKSKPGMVSAALELMRGMSAEELSEKFPDLMDALSEQDDVEDDDDEENNDDNDNNDDEDNDDKKDKNENKKSVKKEAKNKYTKEDLDLAEDIKAVFKGDEELSEEFKDRATLIFENAIVNKVNEVVAELNEENAEELESLREETVKEMAEKLDGFLNYVVEEWEKENTLAIESGIRNEISESFITGLKSLFEEHWIDIPDSKVDVVEELGEQVADLQESLDREIEKNVNLTKGLVELKKNDVLDELCDGLVDTDAEKLRSLVENVDFEDEESYKEKLTSIKESYFSSDDDNNILVEDLDFNSLDEEEDTNKPTTREMAPYVSAISRHSKTINKKNKE